MKKKISLLSISLVSLASTNSLSGLSPADFAWGASSTNSQSRVLKFKDGLEPKSRAYINQGQWADAIDQLKRLADSDKVCSANEAWLAFAYLYQGKHAELKDLFEKVKAMPVNDKDPDAAKIVTAFALTSQGKLDDAEKALASLDEQANKNLLALFAKACVNLKKGNPKAAVSYCEACVELEPSFAWGYRTLGFIQEKSLKNPGSAEIAYAKALAQEPKFKEACDLLVDLRLSKNDFDGAIAAAQESIKAAPRNSNNYYRLAQIYKQQWRLKEALELLEKAIVLDNSDARYHRSKAAIFRQQNKITEAISEQKQAVDLSKDRIFELIELANLEEQNGNIAEAIASLQNAVKSNPDNAAAAQKLVAMLIREKRYDDLVAQYKQAVEHEPKSTPLRLGLADALKKTGKLNEAIDQLKEAANLDQKNPQPHRETGKIELDRKDYSAAAKAYTRALNINPSSVEDLVALGFCYANNCDYMQAETAFVTGLALQQLGQTTGSSVAVNPFDIMRSLSSVLLIEGRYREAAVNLEAVVGADKNPDQKRNDQFMLAQTRALRDRTADTRKELITAFSALTAEEQNANKTTLIDTLFDLGNTATAIELARKSATEPTKLSTNEELAKICPLALIKVIGAEGKPKDAQALAKQLLLETKNEPELRSEVNRELGLLLAEEKDFKGAEEALKKAIELNPKSFNAFVTQSQIFLSANKTDAAINSAQRAQEMNPYSVPAYLALANAYMTLADKTKDAEANYLKAVELYPTSIEAHKGLGKAFEKLSKTADLKRENEIISNLEKNS